MTDYAFTETQLINMRYAQTGHMLDTCVLQTFSRTFDSMGSEVATYTDAEASQACGLDMRPGSERNKTDMTVVQYDGTVRLAITATPDEKDRVKVTKRFGETLASALTFDIVGPIQRGPSGVRLLLKDIST